MSEPQPPESPDDNRVKQRDEQRDQPTPPPLPPMMGYRSPRDEPNPNSPGRFVLRSLVGLAIGVIAMFLGWPLMAATDNVAVLFLPLAVCIVSALTYSLVRQRFGYVTGMLVAPMVLVGVAAMVILIQCGVFLSHK